VNEANNTPELNALSPFLLENEAEYLAWRKQKLANYPVTTEDMTVSLESLDSFCVQQRDALLTIANKTNMVLYSVKTAPSKEDVSDFAFLLGLSQIDRNICADNDSITSLCVRNDSELHKTYIPYSNKALSWHTDGYYNSEEHQIQAFLMHCVREAKEGGDNQFLDPEIMYILLRDDNPESIDALMAVDALTIPANIQHKVEIRSAQTGTVFSVDLKSNCLHMRYSARKKNISWKVEDRVQYARNKIEEILNSNVEYCFNYTPRLGQGIITNNVLHNRSKFVDHEASKSEKTNNEQSGRLIYRARFYDRLNLPSNLE